MTRARLILLLSLVLLVGGFFALGWQRYLTLDYVKAQQSAIGVPSTTNRGKLSLSEPRP